MKQLLILLLILTFPTISYAGRYSILISSSLTDAQKIAKERPKVVKSVLVKKSTVAAPIIYRTPIIYSTPSYYQLNVPIPRMCAQCLK